MLRIAIIGTGYVGLVTGACFAEMGRHVTCLDVDSSKVDQLNRGSVPFYEPGLEEMVHRNLDANRLAFTCDPEQALEGAQIVFIAVPTPAEKSGAADLSFVKAAVQTACRYLTTSATLVMKSTVPVGTGSVVKRWISELLDSRQDSAISVSYVSNPEFLKQGNAVMDFLKPDRVILGVDNAETEEIMKELYAVFSHSSDRILSMDIPSAEMTKYAANAMLATRISFINEIANLCEATGADVSAVRKGMGADPRIGHLFLYPGIGFGGSCFPKDLEALQAMATEKGCSSEILKAVARVNSSQRLRFIDKILAYFEPWGGVEGKVLAVWGLSFKPETDDLRCAPSLDILEALLQHGAHLRLYDPVAMPATRRYFGERFASQIYWARNELDSVVGSDGIVLLTEWKPFRTLEAPDILPLMRGRAFFDGRNQYRPKEMAKRGFDYISVGRPPAWAPEASNVEAAQTPLGSH